MVRRKQSTSKISSTSSSEISTKTTVKRKKPRKTNPVMIGNKMFVVNVTTLRDVRKLQSTTHLLIPRLCFARVVKEVLGEYNYCIRIQLEALVALQEAAEAFLIQLFEDSYMCALHCKRITLFPRDMRIALRLRGDWNYIQS